MTWHGRGPFHSPLCLLSLHADTRAGTFTTLARRRAAPPAALMRFVAAKHGGDALRAGRGALGARRRLVFLVATPLALLFAGAVWSVISRSSEIRRGGGVRQAPQRDAVTSVRAAAGGDAAPVVYGFTVVATYPHDHTCFTQGLQARRKGGWSEGH